MGSAEGSMVAATADHLMLGAASKKLQLRKWQELFGIFACE